MRKAGIITTEEKKRWKLTDDFKRTLSENKWTFKWNMNAKILKAQ
jgi:hypothetical protein